MPSANFLREAVRNHPVVVATTAATAGVLLGGFVAVQLLAVPEKTKADGATPPQVTAETKPVAKPVAETNGSASSVAATDCEQQTWPYLSRACMEELRRRNPAPRVVSTDKPGVIESQPATPPVESKPMLASPIKPAVAATAPPDVAVSTPPADPAPVAAPAVAASTAEAVQPDSKPDAKAEDKQKRQAKKTKRKPKPAVKPDPQDDEENRNVASSDSDDEDGRGADRRAERRPGRSGRIVERWTEREYDVDSEDGGRRRVTVIRRNRGGPFENLFGMGRDRDDED
jgi:hypothetical protein